MSKPNASTLTTYTITEVVSGHPVAAGIAWFKDAYERATLHHKEHNRQLVIQGPEPALPEIEGEWFVGEAAGVLT
jgi:hypothetical protein